MKFQIRVTRDDIRKGVKDSPCNCPIARAAKRVFGTKNVNVSGEAIEVGYGYGGYETLYLPLPKAGERFVEAFDDGKPVTPQTFTVSI